MLHLVDNMVISLCTS